MTLVCLFRYSYTVSS